MHHTVRILTLLPALGVGELHPMIVDLVLQEMPSAASVLNGGIFKLFAAQQQKWERSTKRTQIHSWGDWTHRTVQETCGECLYYSMVYLLSLISIQEQRSR